MLRLRKLLDYAKREAGLFRQFLLLSQADAVVPPLPVTWADSRQQLQRLVS